MKPAKYKPTPEIEFGDKNSNKPMFSPSFLLLVEHLYLNAI